MTATLFLKQVGEQSIEYQLSINTSKYLLQLMCAHFLIMLQERSWHDMPSITQQFKQLLMNGCFRLHFSYILRKLLGTRTSFCNDTCTIINFKYYRLCISIQC